MSEVVPNMWTILGRPVTAYVENKKEVRGRCSHVDNLVCATPDCGKLRHVAKSGHGYTLCKECQTARNVKNGAVNRAKAKRKAG